MTHGSGECIPERIPQQIQRHTPSGHGWGWGSVTSVRVRTGPQKEGTWIRVLDRTPALHGSLLFPIYHYSVQIKVVWFPDLVFTDKLDELPPHLIHKGVILLIVCSHDNGVCFWSDIHFSLLSHRERTPQICIFSSVCPLSGHKPDSPTASETRTQTCEGTYCVTRQFLNQESWDSVALFRDYDTKTSAECWLVVFCLWDIPLMQPNSFLRPDHIRFSVNIGEKSLQQQTGHMSE